MSPRLEDPYVGGFVPGPGARCPTTLLINAAQDVTDRLVAAGVTSILNFAPAVCAVPDGVSMRKVDLAIELQILSFYQLRRAAPKVGT